jgi:hypothetical protein
VCVCMYVYFFVIAFVFFQVQKGDVHTKQRPFAE